MVLVRGLLLQQCARMLRLLGLFHLNMKDLSVRCPVTGKRMECRRQAGRGVEQLQWGLSRLEPLGA